LKIPSEPRDPRRLLYVTKERRRERGEGETLQMFELTHTTEECASKA